MSKRILFISNGHGEDGIMAKLIETFDLDGENYDIFVLPMVGKSTVFNRLKNITKIGPQKETSSGGFIKSFKNIVSDIREGLIALHLQQLRNARKQSYDMVVVVGDFFPFLMSMLFLKYNHMVLISTAKSDRFEKHFFFERFFFRAQKALVYARDLETAQSLVNKGVNAHYKGNIMMDEVTCFPKKRTKVASNVKIGVLPGSRVEAYKNFMIIKKVINHLPRDWPIQVAVSKLLDKGKFVLSDIDQQVDFVDFSELLKNSDAVIGLAGTANEQCVGCGVPVFAFPATGMQTTRKRFLQQKKLLNGLVEYVDTSDSVIIAKRIIECLSSECFVENVRVNGPESMGKPGGAAAIAGDIKCILEF